MTPRNCFSYEDKTQKMTPILKFLKHSDGLFYFDNENFQESDYNQPSSPVRSIGLKTIMMEKKVSGFNSKPIPEEFFEEASQIDVVVEKKESPKLNVIKNLPINEAQTRKESKVDNRLSIY